MSVVDIVDYALDHSLFSDNIAGKTPAQTMKSKLSVHIRTLGDQSRFVRTAPGRFFLRDLVSGKSEIFDAKPLSPPGPTENVLVFRPDRLDAIGRFQGIRPISDCPVSDLLDPSVCSFAPRLAAEKCTDYKQVLTYVLVRRGAEFIAYRRGTYNRVEDYLKGSRCVGFGGHVSEVDFNLFGIPDYGLQNCAVRELSEELRLAPSAMSHLAGSSALRLIGVLNDDSSLTGLKHIAFVFVYDVDEDEHWLRPRKREKSITQPHWVNPSAADFRFWEYEYWSQLCIEHLVGDATTVRPEYLVRRPSRLRPPHTVCVIGRVGSGKTEATRLLKAEYGYVEVNSGRVVAELLGIPPVPETPRGVFQKRALEFIRSPGAATTLATALHEKANSMPGKRVLIDGIRQLETLEQLQTLRGASSVGTLYVHTPPHVACELYSKRMGYPVPYPDFLAIRDAEVEADVEKMIKRSDAVLYNFQGVAAYRQALRQLMSSVGVSRLKEK